MKRLVKRGLKLAWRATWPLRRPVQTRLDAYLRRCFASASFATCEIDLTLNHVVRELIRLQDQVDQLQQSVDELTAAADRPTELSLVSDRQAS